jgi:hypothetical protein
MIVEVDIFHKDKFIYTANIIKEDAEKVKNDIEEVWGYPAKDITFAAYYEKDYNEILEIKKCSRIVLKKNKMVEITGEML